MSDPTAPAPVPPPPPGPAPATQVVHPWRATVRTVVAAALAIIPVLPAIAESLGIATIPVVATILTVAGGVTRILAIPAVEEWLHDHLPGMAAKPPLSTTKSG